MDWIEVNPAVCSGKPVIRGARIMARNILGVLAGGYTVEQIVSSYPELSRLDEVQVRILLDPQSCGPSAFEWAQALAQAFS